MKKRALVLGCGMVGATMARDMAADSGFDVTVADLSEKNLEKLATIPKVQTVQADLSKPDRVTELAASADVVLGAMPSRFGLQTLRAVIESRRPYADISFMPEDALQLDGLAKERGVTAVVDCGVSPGLSNLIIGFAHVELDDVEEASIYVGGLPAIRRWPFDYKAPFAPSDVIEEYTRPARLIEHGRVVIRPALSEPEFMDFPQTGTLEAFNTDGLRSLLHTVRVKNMKEKTLRYPGHRALMEAFRETGYFSTVPIEVGGARVRPLDLTAKLLFPKWTYEAGEREFTVLRVMVEGTKGAVRNRFVFDLYDETDSESGASSMARTTAFPCTIVARMLARGEVAFRGVHAPEALGAMKPVFEQILNELSARGVRVSRKREVVT